MLDFFYLLVKSLLLPPGLFILLMLLGFLLRRLFFVILALLILYILSTPFVARQLISGLEVYPALTETQIGEGQAQAIVVLGAGRYLAAPEYSADTVSAAALVRLRYAAYLHRKTGLKIYATGGIPYQEGTVPEAELAKQALENELGTGPVEVEDDSNNTRENAQLTAKLLERDGIQKVYLVSHAWHLPRAVTEFERVGIKVVPAPTRFYGGGPEKKPTYRMWLPNIGALMLSRTALHEYLGQAWYEMRNIWRSFQQETAELKTAQ